MIRQEDRSWEDLSSLSIRHGQFLARSKVRIVGNSYLGDYFRVARDPCTIAKVSANLVTIELFSDRFYNMLVDAFVHRLVF